MAKRKAGERTPFEEERSFQMRRRAQVIYPAVALALTGSSWILADSKFALMVEYRFGVIGLFQFLTIAGLIFSIGALAWVYLQTGFKSPSEVDRQIDRARVAMRQLANGEIQYVEEPMHQRSDEDLEDVRARLDRLEASQPVQSVETDLQVERLASQVIEEGSERLLSLASEKLDARLSSRAGLASVDRLFEQTKARIYSEVGRLNIRGNLNLVIGMSISISGVMALGYFVSQETVLQSDVSKYAMHFLPRLSLVLLIQAFAFFFLKLYKSSLDEIKYYQNELTNIEQRHAAINLTLIEGTDERRDLIDTLAKVERNHLLTKGASTIDLERARIEAQGGALEAMKSLAPFIAKMK